MLHKFLNFVFTFRLRIADLSRFRAQFEDAILPIWDANKDCARRWLIARWPDIARKVSYLRQAINNRTTCGSCGTGCCDAFSDDTQSTSLRENHRRVNVNRVFARFLLILFIVSVISKAARPFSSEIHISTGLYIS